MWGLGEKTALTGGPQTEQGQVSARGPLSREANALLKRARAAEDWLSLCLPRPGLTRTTDLELRHQAGWGRGDGELSAEAIGCQMTGRQGAWGEMRRVCPERRSLRADQEG